jgi:SMODS and SLOG-associating 2TM effector domain
MATHETTDFTKEKHLSTSDAQAVSPPTSSTGTKSTFPTEQKHLENLRKFQDLVGIRTPPHILSTGTLPSQELRDLEKGSKLPTSTSSSAQDTHYYAGRPKRSFKDLIYRTAICNDGIYGRAVDEELKARIGFTISNWFINSLYVVQIFVAATITGLASYHGHEIPLTVLGAVNAVLAGLMALIKGQGLPVRLRRSRDQFQNVMKSIENTERMFARFVHMGDDEKKMHDPFKEFQILEDLFDAAKKDQRDSKCCLTVSTILRIMETPADAACVIQIIRICTQILMRGRRFRR